MLCDMKLTKLTKQKQASVEIHDLIKCVMSWHLFAENKQQKMERGKANHRGLFLSSSIFAAKIHNIILRNALINLVCLLYLC